MHWSGRTTSSELTPELATIYKQTFSYIHIGQWEQTIEHMRQHALSANKIELDSPSYNSILHYAARDGISIQLVRQMEYVPIHFLSIRNSDNQIPLHLAQRNNHNHLTSFLAPKIKHFIPNVIMQQLEQNFHQLILQRAETQIHKFQYHLPQLDLLLELSRPIMYFYVPEYQGGFRYWLRASDNTLRLICRSGSNLVNGGMQLHEVTENTITFLADDFQDNYSTLTKKLII